MLICICNHITIEPHSTPNCQLLANSWLRCPHPCARRHPSHPSPCHPSDHSDPRSHGGHAQNHPWSEAAGGEPGASQGACGEPCQGPRPRRTRSRGGHGAQSAGGAVAKWDAQWMEDVETWEKCWMAWGSWRFCWTFRGKISSHFCFGWWYVRKLHPENPKRQTLPPLY